mmetsp:Transcript_15928/g.18779  ORF Transcript_15928/g.18779 Transcript_15928/m.18779 type:complete len:243 (-) Transcript_15928:106-834(-)
MAIRITRRSSSTHHNLLVETSNCFVAHFPDFFPSHYSASIFHELKNDLPWKIEKDEFGPQSRSTHYVGDKDAIFHYVGLTLHPNPWTNSLNNIRYDLEKKILPIVRNSLNLDQNNIQTLNGCLLNYFKKDNGFIPWHSDEIRAHGDLKCIITVSLGGPRLFQLKPKKKLSDIEIERDIDTEIDDNNNKHINVWLGSGSVLVMAGNTQEFYEHALPLLEPSPSRISLTFRSIIPGFERQLTNQ